MEESLIKEYAFLITIVFIVVSAMIGAFMRRRKRDRCLKDFTGNRVTLEHTGGKTVWGRLRVENTGLELVYQEKKTDKQGHVEGSYILYKNEYPGIQAVIRFHDDLSAEGQRRRTDDLNKTYKPNFFRRSRRRIANIFKTVRDSFMEVANLMLAQAKKSGPAGAILSDQDKYVNQMKQELMGSVGTAYEPLLERYIGHRVVLEILKAEKWIEYDGVLKEYTANFIEIMDVDYSTEIQPKPRKADLIVPRKYGLVRHLGE
jgi:small nuclear ribonucleoprotein (snRNP)-like protein